MEMAVITPKDLKAVCEAKTGGDKIIDLRLPSEYARGHIVGAVNMPFAAFLVNAGSLDKTKRIIVYSDQLEQEHNGVRRLQKLGFTKVARADFVEWVKAGMPVVKK